MESSKIISLKHNANSFTLFSILNNDIKIEQGSVREFYFYKLVLSKYLILGKWIKVLKRLNIIIHCSAYISNSVFKTINKCDSF